MRRIVFGVALWLVVTSGAYAECKSTLYLRSPEAIGFSLCPKDVVPIKNDKVVIEAGGGQIVTQVTLSENTLGTQTVSVKVIDPSKAQENMLLLTGVDTATITVSRAPNPVVDSVEPVVEGAKPVAADANPVAVTEKPFMVDIQHGSEVRNVFHYSWSLGPATPGSKSGATGSSGADPGASDPNSSPGAVRLKYTGEYTNASMFGGMKDSQFLTSASLAIDTTDQHSPDFVDNNQASLGVHLKNLSFGRLWMHGQLGIEAQVEKAFHQDVRNVDALLTASGWVPILRSFTLLSQKGEFIAAPLSF
jgi:hypothetical protein